jgi:hypothetical protein
MTKYQEYFKRMLETKKELFDSFRFIHNEYAIAADPDKLQDKFNKEGEKVMLIVRDWEQKLCSQSEKAGFGSYTTSLAEKFQAEVKKEFPMIDHVGVIVKKYTLTPKTLVRGFTLKKIELK